MKRSQLALKTASEIVGRGTFSWLDLDKAGPLAQHIGCAYDNWCNASIAPVEKLQLEVYEVLAFDLGYVW